MGNYVFFFGRDFQLIARRAKQPIKRAVRPEKEDAVIVSGASPIACPVEISELHPVSEIEVVKVFFGYVVVDQDVIGRRDKREFSVAAAGKS